MTYNICHHTFSIIAILLLPCFPKATLAQKNKFRQEVEQIAQTAKGNVGVAIMNLEDRDTLTFHGKARFPMQSVFKFPLALAVLKQVDKGKFSLNQNIQVTKQDLLPDTYSPLRDKYPNGSNQLTLGDLLTFSVSQSDNNACDILFRLAGGTKEVEKYIRSLNVKDMAITATEEEMSKVWNVQYANWSEPVAMLQLLDILYKKKALSKVSNDFLWKIMTETSTGPKRIKGLLPTNTIVAHKTGTSNTNKEGVTAATNDAGIVTLPNGKHFAIVVFVSNSSESTEVREGVIAKITKAAWNYYSAQP